MADLDDVGKKMQSLGCALTLLLTLPIIGLLFFGMLGLVVGLAIGALVAWGMFVAKPDELS